MRRCVCNVPCSVAVTHCPRQLCQILLVPKECFSALCAFTREMVLLIFALISHQFTGGGGLIFQCPVCVASGLQQ